MQRLNTQILEPQSKMEETLRSIWEENNFALDIPIIDLHHTWLVWLLLQLENESNKPDSPESIEKIDTIISELVNFVTEHFWVEECLLDYTEFPKQNSI
jgi:hemerythrin